MPRHGVAAWPHFATASRGLQLPYNTPAARAPDEVLGDVELLHDVLGRVHPPGDGQLGEGWPS